MAIKNITGPATLSSIDVFKTETTATHDLGTLVYGPTGEKYRYALVGASPLVLGNLIQGPITNTTHFDEMAISAAIVAGDTQVTVTLGGTAALVNEFAGGTALFNIAGGVLLGSYTVVANTAQTSTSGTCVLTLAEPMRLAGTSSQKCTLRRSNYYKVIQSAATPTNAPVGVALTAAAASTYTWLQSAGVVAVLSDNTTWVIGSDVAQSATAGAVTLATGVLGRVGTAMQAKNSTGLSTVKLMID